MQEIDLLNSSDLDMKPDEMDEMEIDELFQMAVGDFNDSDLQSVKTSYFMFKKIVERNPKFKGDDGDNAFYYMGRIHEHYLDEIDTAIQYYTRSLELSPDDVDSFENRGICRLRKKQYEMALKDIRKAKKLGGSQFDRDLDGIMKETKNRLNGGKPNKDYDEYF
jgi:tetratricopeptide (TPR) repeat protein